MDQDAFRQLVSAPREEVVGRGQGYDRNFGQTSYRNRERRRAACEPREQQPDWKPRQVGGTEFRGSHSKHAYMDRAEMRRRGIEMPLDVRLPTLPDAEADTAGSENEAPPVSDTDLEQAWESGRAEPGADVPAPDAPKAAFRPITETKEAPDVIYVNGKRMRKKKKKAPEASMEPPIATPEEPSHATAFRPRKATSTHTNTQVHLPHHSPNVKDSVEEASLPSSDTHAPPPLTPATSSEQQGSSSAQGAMLPMETPAMSTSTGVASSNAPKAPPPPPPPPFARGERRRRHFRRRGRVGGSFGRGSASAQGCSGQARRLVCAEQCRTPRRGPGGRAGGTHAASTFPPLRDARYAADALGRTEFERTAERNEPLVTLTRRRGARASPRCRAEAQAQQEGPRRPRFALSAGARP